MDFVSNTLLVLVCLSLGLAGFHLGRLFPRQGKKRRR